MTSFVYWPLHVMQLIVQALFLTFHYSPPQDLIIDIRSNMAVNLSFQLCVISRIENKRCIEKIISERIGDWKKTLIGRILSIISQGLQVPCEGWMLAHLRLFSSTLELRMTCGDCGVYQLRRRVVWKESLSWYCCASRN